MDVEGRVLARTRLDAIGYADVALPAAGRATPYFYLGDGVFLVMLIVAVAIAAVPVLSRPRR
jgi:apolipoprotein N-acyltransferase